MVSLISRGSYGVSSLLNPQVADSAAKLLGSRHYQNIGFPTSVACKVLIFINLWRSFHLRSLRHSVSGTRMQYEILSFQTLADR
jgi:hypothetical protein